MKTLNPPSVLRKLLELELEFIRQQISNMEYRLNKFESRLKELEFDDE